MKKVQILLVEDEQIVAMDIQKTLEKRGYEVCARVNTGEEAIKKAEEMLPDMVLMDIVLKGEIDGVASAQYIHNQLDIPVIYLTAYGDEKTLERAKVTEPYGYILKPYDENQLFTNIEVALYKHRMNKKLKNSEVWLAIALKSIANAVITTDKEYTITFMNPIAEILTGWKRESALGKNLTEIFNIVNEKSGKPLKNPLRTAFADDVIVELGSNTLLVRKDGTKKPIAGASSAVKDKNKTVIGGLLVFYDVSVFKDMEKAFRDKYMRILYSLSTSSI